MTVTEYLESQRGKTYTEIVANQPVETVVGSIRGDDLRDVVDILAKGLQDRLEVAPPSKLRTALNVVFEYLGLANYQINLSITENAELLRNAVTAGLVTQAESDKLFKLATFERSLHNITHKDCQRFFEPELFNIGEWAEYTPTTLRLMLVLAQATPELAAVRIEQRVSHDGIHWTNWDRLTPIIVQAAGVYYHNIPVSNMQRQIRWRGEEYRITGTLEAV